jgi:hypothetical protein
MNSSMNIRTLSASIARTSTRGRFESAAQLLALRRSDFLSQVDFSPPPVATSSPLSPAQLYASDLVVSVDFCAASVIGQFLRTYDPRIVAYHHLVASALVHTWSHASALPTPKTAAPRRTVLNSTLSSSPIGRRVLCTNRHCRLALRDRAARAAVCGGVSLVDK